MAKSFRFGVASWLGSGRQWLSWVHRQDVIRAIQFLLGRDDLQGPFNITSPEPVTGRDFAGALRAHHRTLIRAGVPAPVMRLLVGDMAEELLLNGQRVIPERLQAAGFEFTFSDLQSALTAIYDGQTTLRTRSSSG
jgi:NAD dependent epimerase/dehydratase family enzyme